MPARSKLLTNMDADNYGFIGKLITDDGRILIWVDDIFIIIVAGNTRRVTYESIPIDMQRLLDGDDDLEVEDILGRDIETLV